MKSFSFAFIPSTEESPCGEFNRAVGNAVGNLMRSGIEPWHLRQSLGLGKLSGKFNLIKDCAIASSIELSADRCGEARW